MRRDESGYTIVELVTVLGILMVAIIAVSGFLYTSLNQKIGRAHV